MYWRDCNNNRPSESMSCSPGGSRPSKGLPINQQQPPRHSPDAYRCDWRLVEKRELTSAVRNRRESDGGSARRSPVQVEQQLLRFAAGLFSREPELRGRYSAVGVEDAD